MECNECSACKKQFSTYSNLRTHLKKFHPRSVVDNLAPLKRQQKEYQFTCPCGKHFNHKRHYSAHLKTHSDGDNTLDNTKETGACTLSRQIKLKCSLCTYENRKSSNLFDHFKSSHDIKINVHKLNFKQFDDFTLWRCGKENDTNSRYVKHRGSVIKKTITELNYYCHRSGFLKSESKGLRHQKIQGSNKINGFCPAGIKVLLNKNGLCDVTFTDTHIGHSNDLGHLWLTSSERESIAAKIALKIPFPAILEEVRDNLSEESFKRSDLITKKDLYNIEAAYNLQSGAVRHQNDAISIEAWVNEMKKGNSCVLFYKAQDCVLADYPQLKSSDFLLIIMNEGQKQILKKFCNDCICVDSTHGLNSYQFEMHTLMVLDDLRQGFPCAFFIGNRADEGVLKIFFEQIRDHIGMQIKPKVFMSDMAPGYYNAWISVMHQPEKRLFCAWHILHAWSNKLTLISSKDKQTEIFNKLRTILEETDQEAFYDMLHNFILKTSDDPETSKFSAYFKEYYLKNTKSWAYCHRLHSGLNTNMHLERMHKTIKYFYLNGKNVKRLDKAIIILMRFVKDKLFDRIISLHKGKLSSKLIDLRSRHKTSLTLKTDMICKNGNGWDIPSASKTLEVYHVQKNETTCSNCPLRCKDCQTCIHQFSCSCLDSAIKWNMCKHIHVICRFLNATLDAQDNQDSQDENQELHIHEDSKQAESRTLMEALIGSSETARNGVEIEKEREEIRLHLNQVIDKIDTRTKLSVFKKQIASIEPTFLAMEQGASNIGKGSSLCKNVPANKKILAQRRFYATKKVPKKKQNKRIQKLSQEDKNKLAVEMLLNK